MLRGNEKCRDIAITRVIVTREEEVPFGRKRTIGGR